MSGDNRKMDNPGDFQEEEPIDTAASDSSLTNPVARFALKKWIAHGQWSWDVAVDNCAICRNPIMDLCIECQANPNDEKEHCTAACGQCNHAFHYHCIARWLRSRKVCPLDNKEWIYQSTSH
ncbi:RING-box protein 1B-like [Drosophila tropicalis]|uniref:RING-box protein 1B-like n=1 Tax=Drosophila tropicalis TaxID=46794 RepID=UPI0035AC176B